MLINGHTVTYVAQRTVVQEDAHQIQITEIAEDW